MKPSLCVDARMLFSSGIGTYIRNLLPKLEEFEITALILEKDAKPLSLLCDAKPIFLKAPIYSALEQVKLPFLIPPCDLFWSPHYNTPLFPILSKKRVVTIHDLCHLERPECFSSFKRKCAYFLLSKASKQSDLILTVSDFSKRQISHYFPDTEKKIQLVPCAVTSFKKAPSFAHLQRKKPFILYVGNIKPHKNIQRLIEAFLKIPDSSLELVLAGSLFSKIKIPPRVILLENLSDEEISFLYRQAKLLIQPSLYEGFGLTPLEAMSYGCPVVSSFLGSLPEVCGEAAKYVDPLNIDSIYQGMQEVLTNPSLKSLLIEKGYERARFFSWEASAKKLSTLFLKEITS